MVSDVLPRAIYVGKGAPESQTPRAIFLLFLILEMVSADVATPEKAIDGSRMATVRESFILHEQGSGVVREQLSTGGVYWH
ncbi:hypothetical protein DDT56_22370 [Brenneria corticis]|uniref:Uncharacterized protein n=1 Tax=Brenneria corticis TaxID=2173106 RepID=A0A2U1TLK8_9GAMM|nr:hypothetical protein DDT56_22370 [Brenneria sp. CFCC 11842]